MDSHDWTVAYLGWLLAALAGGLVGCRVAYWHYRYRRAKLIQRWRFERRKHRQRNPWVKVWIASELYSGHQWTKAEQGRMINKKHKPFVPSMIKVADNEPV
jgi:membrane protein DedA with SNARE-associated domain